MDKRIEHNYSGYGSLSESDFERLSSFIYTHFGIHLTEKKHYLLQTRLVKRLRALQISSYAEYADYVLKSGINGDEAFEMIDVVSTNKTDFFREKAHFEYLSETLIPQWSGQKLKAWSAGCSSGQEAYSLCMILQQEKSKGSISDYEVHGNDISAGILEKATRAVYPFKEVTNIPYEFRKKYLLRSKQKEEPQIRIVPNLRTKAQFHRINLLDEIYPLAKDFQLIFCRNTLIYFDSPTKKKIVTHLCSHLAMGGYLVIGFSESLLDMDMKAMHMSLIKPTIYQKI